MNTTTTAVKSKYTLVSLLDLQIANYDEGIAKCKQKMEENFLYHFEWGYPAGLYTEMSQRRAIAHLRDFAKGSPEKVKEYLERQIQNITQELLGGQYANHSTNEFHNIAYRLNKEVAASTLSCYKSYLERIVEHNMPIL